MNITKNMLTKDNLYYILYLHCESLKKKAFDQYTATQGERDKEE